MTMKVGNRAIIWYPISILIVSVWRYEVRYPQITNVIGDMIQQGEEVGVAYDSVIKRPNVALHQPNNL